MSVSLVGRIFTVVTLFAFSALVHCNTESVNLARPSSLEIPISVSSDWTVLSTHPGQSAKRLAIIPALEEFTRLDAVPHSPSDLWLRLEIDEWKTWDVHSPSFTLRLSWPASMPANFDISLFRPPGPHSSSGADIMYTRIRAISTGLMPGGSRNREAVHFDIIIEPLVLGFLPQSMVPVLGLVLVTMILAACTVPFLTSSLSRIADRAAMEVSEKKDI